MIFLHELSHWAAGTKDIYKHSRDERPYVPEEDRETKCYGASNGTVWAKMRGRYKDGIIKAIWNADNVGFFVTQFYFSG